MASVDFKTKVDQFFGRRSINFLILTTGFLTLFSCAPKPNALPLNEYGLGIVKKKGTYRYIAKLDESRAMVALDKWLQPLVTAFAYATDNNFTKQILYKKPKAYLRLEAAMALKKVQDTLHGLGLDIQIFDAYRPYSATKKMWDIVPDDRYAANPANGSGHNRGIAIDLTLIDMKTGKELEMPTSYDNFSDTAHHDFVRLEQHVSSNRALLKQVMEQYGFKALSTEWWHYSLPEPKRYELLDLSFKKMKRIIK